MNGNPHSESQPPASCALSLVIGVTGHRDLRAQDVPALESAVRSYLSELRKTCPNTPLVLLSPFAEGADRLVARVALDEGAKLVVPLPLPRAEYEKDFEHSGDPAGTDRSKAEFEALLRRSVKCVELPLAAGNTLLNISSYGVERDRQYAQVGAYIVRHSQILIALWDGVTLKPELVGGTAQIVRYRLAGLPAEYAPAPNPLDAIDAGPVVHIVTPREKNPQPVLEPFSRHPLVPGDWGNTGHSMDEAKHLDPLAAVLRRLEDYNADARRLCSALSSAMAKSRSDVMPAAQAAHLPSGARAILDQYGVADTLAQYFQVRRKRVLISLFSIAVAAVFCFELYAHLMQSLPVLVLYPLALLLGFVVYRFAVAGDYHNKHLDYRALAEGLRVQLFWTLAGLQDEVPDHYLRKQRTELEWIRAAIRSQLRLCDWGLAGAACVGPVPAPLDGIRDLVLPHWVANQHGYFADATARDHRNIQKRERWALWLLFAGLAAAALVVGLRLAGAITPDSDLHNALIVMMGFAPAIAAAMGGYAEKMVFASQAKRYQWMAELFERAERRLSDAIQDRATDKAQQIIRELGSEALGENGDWVLMHRERAPEALKGT